MEEEEEDWNGDKQKEKELKELKLKNNNITGLPQYQSTSTTDTAETVLAPQLTDTLMPSKTEEQKEDNMQNSSGDDSETDVNLDNTLNNIVL